MPRRRTIRSLPRFKESPYPDGSITFKSFLWEMYHEPISMAEDERIYSNGLLRFLEKNAILVERYTKYEREIEDDEENYLFSSGYTLYLYKDNLIPLKDQDDGAVTVDSYYPTSRKCVLDEFKQFLIKEKGESKISVLVSRNGGLAANKITFAAPAIPDVELNYGTGFNQVYSRLVETLKEGRTGLILLHGDPGTGKSFLLKHLTSIVDREFVFVGASMIPRLSDPELISLLLNKKGAVLILEDAEQAIQKRTESSDASTTSTILNLTEGFLSSVLGLTVIASYNVDSSQVDSALLRRGRLMYKHSFGKLSKGDAERLAKHLGKKIDVTGPMSLADIYNSGEDAGQPQVVEPVRQMGFHTLINPTPKSGPTSDKVGSEQKS